MSNGSFDLVGRCPVCSGPETADESVISEAFIAPDFADSDKQVPLVWSFYWNQNVCRLCEIRGNDFDIENAKQKEDNRKERDRQKMGYRITYQRNTLLA